MIPRTYPWSSLPRVRRQVAETVSSMRQALTHPRVVRALRALNELVGTTFTVALENIGADMAATLGRHSLVIRLSPPDNDAEPFLLLDADAALVALIAARVMRRPPPTISKLGPSSPVVVGAFAAVVAGAVRRAGVPVVVTVVADEPPHPLEGFLVASMRVVADAQATYARAILPVRLLTRGAPRLVAAHLATLGDVPLSLPLVACRVTSTAEELSMLAVGDAFVLGEAWPLGPINALRGSIVLCGPRSERGAAAELLLSGKVVLREGGEELGWSTMTEQADELRDVESTSPIVETVGEVPVVVRVELGAATMTAREWSQLQPGDVVGLGSRPGAPVTLRVSGFAVAEGELVDLDGEVAVRILRRVAASRP